VWLIETRIAPVAGRPEDRRPASAVREYSVT
jgi:hypothetical protein